MNDDWLDVETPEDWLSTEPVASVPAVIEEPRLLSAIQVPETVSGKLDRLKQCWDRLKPKQQTFLDTLRSCRWNVRATVRALSGTSAQVPLRTAHSWREQDDYEFCFKVLQQDDAGTVLDKNKLLLRHDDIVEQLMTPTPILHQGAATGYFENRAPAASKANEVLMKAAGLLKNDDQTTRHVVRFVNLAGPEVAQSIEVATEIT